MFGLQVEPQPPIDVYYTPGQVIPFGTFEVRPHHTPGHCPGGVCLQIGRRARSARSCSSATRSSPGRLAGRTCRAAITRRSSRRSGRCSSPSETTRSSIRATAPTRPSATNAARIRFSSAEPESCEPHLMWRSVFRPCFSTVSSIRPTRSRSPLAICARSTRLSLTNVPFVLARSSTSSFSSPAVRRQCRRETSARSTMKSARAARPMVLIAPALEPKRQRRVFGSGVWGPWGFWSRLQNPHAHLAGIVCSQLTMALDTSALTRLSFRVGILVCFAGRGRHEQMIDAAHLHHLRAAARFFRLAASASRRSALTGATCVSSSPWTMSTGCWTSAHDLGRVEREEALEPWRVGLAPIRLQRLPAGAGQDGLLNSFLQIERRLLVRCRTGWCDRAHASPGPD